MSLVILIRAGISGVGATGGLARVSLAIGGIGGAGGAVGIAKAVWNDLTTRSISAFMSSEDLAPKALAIRDQSP